MNRDLLLNIRLTKFHIALTGSIFIAFENSKIIYGFCSINFNAILRRVARNSQRGGGGGGYSGGLGVEPPALEILHFFAKIT